MRDFRGTNISEAQICFFLDSWSPFRDIRWPLVILASDLEDIDFVRYVIFVSLTYVDIIGILILTVSHLI